MSIYSIYTLMYTEDNHYFKGTKEYYDQLSKGKHEDNETILKLVRHKYYVEKLSLKKVSDEIGIPHTSLQRLMKQYGIKLRTRSEALTLHLEKHPEAHQHHLGKITFKRPEIRRLGEEANAALRSGKTYEEIYGVEEATRIRKLLSFQRTGEKNVNFGKKRPQHVCDALSKAHKGIPQTMENKTKRLKKAFEALRMSPNKLEQRLIDLVTAHTLPFRFVGDGALIINGMCPDFVSTDDTKMIIECFGTYWHSNEVTANCYHRTEEGRQKVLSDLGYKVLIIWEKDMNAMTDNELLSIITTFHKS